MARDESGRADRAAVLRGRGGAERGSAVVDFVLIGALVTIVAVGVIQVALAQHVHNTLVDCAAEGARYAALADRTPEDGAQRARDLIVSALSSSYAQDVTAERVTVDGREVIEVQVTAPMPVLGLLGPSGSMTVVGHALAAAP